MRLLGLGGSRTEGARPSGSWDSGCLPTSLVGGGVTQGSGAKFIGGCGLQGQSFVSSIFYQGFSFPFLSSSSSFSFSSSSSSWPSSSQPKRSLLSPGQEIQEYKELTSSLCCLDASNTHTVFFEPSQFLKCLIKSYLKTRIIANIENNFENRRWYIYMYIYTYKTRLFFKSKNSNITSISSNKAS